MAKNVEYWQEGKDEFSKARQTSGGRFAGRPRNERPPVFGCLLKCAVDLKKLQISQTGQSFTVEAVLEECVKAAEKQMPKVCSITGAQ
jgi:hypothetical protein